MGKTPVIALGAQEHLRRLLSSTNIIENCNEAAQDRCRRGNRWRNGEMVVRWAVSSLTEVEKNFRRVVGWRNLRTLLQALEQDATPNSVDKIAVNEYPMIT